MLNSMSSELSNKNRIMLKKWLKDVYNVDESFEDLHLVLASNI